MTQSQSVLTTNYQSQFPQQNSESQDLPMFQGKKVHAHSMKWLEATVESRKRRAELQRVLVKRKKASKMMQDDHHRKVMAKKLLNSTFHFDTRGAVGRSPLCQLD